MSDIEPSKAGVSPGEPAAPGPGPVKPAPASPAGKAPAAQPAAAKKATDQALEPEMEKGTMSFWDHLDELRSRMFKMALAFAVGAIGCWQFKERILATMTQPLVEGWVGGGKVVLHSPTPAALFLAYIKIAVFAGILVAMPIIFYQIWAFVAPGLYAKEKRLAIPFVIVSTLLFVGGAYFGWVFALAMAFNYLLSFAGDLGNGLTLENTIMIGDYIDFVVRLLLAFGVSFELPVIVFFLAFSGIVTHKQLLRFSRYFIVLAFFISAIITPPDVMSQFLLAVPLIALYFVSILIAWLVQRKPPAKAADEAASS
jgi:sec-independent protein translocase protein TatC